MKTPETETTSDLVLIDDKPLARLGLKQALEQAGGLRVVGEARDVRAASSIIDRTHPAIVVIDLWLPGRDGVSGVLDILSRSPRTRVVVFTGAVRPRDVRDALAAGATGYVAKPDRPVHIVEAVRAARLGERYLSPSVQQAVDAAGDDELAALSEREREVFALAVRGFSNRQIAKEMCIAVSTVGSHRRRVNEKLGCHGTADLFRYAVAHGLLREPSVERLPSAGGDGRDH
jgi:DNA-binding NarL/FixJ family response regulator